MPTAYLYTADGSYAGSLETSGRLPHNATFTPPPPLPWERRWPRWQVGAWQLVEDHRERPAPLFGPDLAQEATEYWLPGDGWQGQPRYMSALGPLPQGALTEPPEKPAATALAEARAAKTAEIEAGYRAALAASLTMPQEAPGVEHRENYTG